VDEALSEACRYVDIALDDMAGILRELGDELANRSPDPEGVNSPYVLLTHCLGVISFWAGEIIAGRDVGRDRPAEFVANGPVPELIDRLPQVKSQLRGDLQNARWTDRPATPSQPGHWVGEQPSVGNIVLHILQELDQHLGHMEVTRDWLRSRGL
jgi:hypothetical protein